MTRLAGCALMVVSAVIVVLILGATARAVLSRDAEGWDLTWRDYERVDSV